MAGIDAAFGQAYAWNPSARGVKSGHLHLLRTALGDRHFHPALPEVDLAAVWDAPPAVRKSGIAGNSVALLSTH